MAIKNDNYIKSLRRAVSVLKCFTPEQPELSGSEVAHKLGIHKTTAHRMLATLAEDGLLDRDGKTGKYMIGPALYAMGSLYLSTTDVVKTAEPVVKVLNDLSGEVVNIGIRDKQNVIVVMKEESNYPVRFYHHIGSVMPAYASAMGKALLSELTEAELDSLFPEEKLRPLTRKTVATKTELKLELEEIRKTGVSFDREGVYEGAEGIASVVRDASGKAVAGMSISVPVFRLQQIGHEGLLATLIKLGSSLVSYRLGYQDTANPVRTIEEIRSWWEQNRLV